MPENVDDKKDFFHIGKMTETYRETPNAVNLPVITLAIAQQLAVISGHLADIAETLSVALERAQKT